MSEASARESDHPGNVARVVLQVAVGRDDEAAARVRKARRERRGLTEVAAEPDDPQPRVLRLELRQQRERLVCAAVVDDDDLVAAAERLERFRELAVELRDVRRLVPHRDDDGDFRIQRVWRDTND